MFTDCYLKNIKLYERIKTEVLLDKVFITYNIVLEL
jgi:hypothetical protein